MNKLKNIMVIMNPQSGRSDGEDLQDSIKQKLNNYFEEVDLKLTEYKGHALELAEIASDEKYDSICSVGGDGTLAEILSGLLNKEYVPKILIFPQGTGNIMSRILQYNQDKEHVIDTIDFCKTKLVDIGSIGDRAFSFILSLGTLPQALDEVTNEEKEKFGFFAYIGNVIRHLKDNNKYELEVTVDNQVYRGPVDHLAASLSDKFTILKINGVNSTLDDGNINVIILKDNSFFKRAKMGIDLIKGNIIQNDSIVFMQGKTLSIKSLNDDEIFVDLDGDKGPKLPIEAKVLNNKIRFYVPKDFDENK